MNPAWLITSSRQALAWSSPLLALAVLLMGCPARKGAGPGVEVAVEDAELGLAPSLSLPDLQGTVHSLRELQGQVVLLDFWATWCDPCRHSLPVYDAWQVELRERGLVVLAVSLDAEGEPVADFAEQLAPDLLVLVDPTGLGPKALPVPVMPTAYLIDRDGKIVSQHRGFLRSEAGVLKDEILRLLDGG